MREGEIRIWVGAFLNLFNISLIFYQLVSCPFCQGDFFLCQKECDCRNNGAWIARALYNPSREGRGREGAQEILK